jgi:hypothetical protein
MPEAAVIDLAAEDVSQLTWDELTLLMLRKDHSNAEYDRDDPDLDPELPICGGCSSCGCVCYNSTTDF